MNGGTWLDPMHGAHPLRGNMDKRAPWQIDSALATRPPTSDQLIELAIEEFTGKDRAEVYRIFERHKPR